MKADFLLREGSRFLKGAMSEYAPSFLKGALTQMLSEVSVDEAVEWVKDDKSLLGEISEEYRVRIRELKLRKVDWLTAPWVIGAVAEKRPNLASLFLNWPQGNEWLIRQCAELKTAFVSG